MRGALTLAERELVRFLRQPNRIMGAVGQPLIFWLLFGAAFRESFRAPGGAADFRQFFLPGIAALIVLFTAIFSTISVIEDRREGFLQGVLVSPLGRGAMVVGKILGGTALATVQALLFVLLAPLAGIPLDPLGLLQVLGVLLLLGVALCGLGFCIAWRMDSTQGFHAIMSVFLLPLWLLSGSIFPAQGLGPVLAWILRLNPLRYGVDALRHALGMGPSWPGPVLSVVVTALFAVAMLGAARWIAGRRTLGDLR